jgi:hypothetical protein
MKYNVHFTSQVVRGTCVEVEAENEEEAKRIAREDLENGDGKEFENDVPGSEEVHIELDTDA